MWSLLSALTVQWENIRYIRLHGKKILCKQRTPVCSKSGILSNSLFLSPSHAEHARSGGGCPRQKPRALPCSSQLKTHHPEAWELLPQNVTSARGLLPALLFGDLGFSFPGRSKLQGFLAQRLTWFGKQGSQETGTCVTIKCSAESLFKEKGRQTTYVATYLPTPADFTAWGKSLQSLSPQVLKNFPAEIHSQGLPPTAPTL